MKSPRYPFVLCPAKTGGTILAVVLLSNNLVACSLKNGDDAADKALQTTEDSDEDGQPSPQSKSDAAPRDGEVLALYDDEALIAQITAEPMRLETKKVKLQVNRVISGSGVLPLMKKLARGLKTNLDASKVTFGAWNRKQPNKKKVLVDYPVDPLSAALGADEPE